MKDKVKETNVPLIMYLEDVKEGVIRDDQAVQRSFCSDNSFINGLGVTVLTADYLQPIILCEVPIDNELNQVYIADGKQRTAALTKIRYFGHKFTSSTEDSVIEYQAKKTDENGKVCRDEDGHYIWEIRKFDIKNKTFDDFPKELKDRFDKFQLKIATHPNCSPQDVSKYVRKYNNHKAMNASQKALTYLDKFAEKAKEISQSDFFKNCVKPSDANRRNGVYEKIVCESVMAVSHLEYWKKSPKEMNIFLNQNAEEIDFEIVKDYFDEIESVCGEEYQDIFVPKDIAVWMAAYANFKKMQLDSKRFVDFLNALKDSLCSVVPEGFDTSWEELDSKSGTKDKKVILLKIDLLKALMKEYFKNEVVDELKFIQDNVDPNLTDDDIEDYFNMIDGYQIDKTAKIFDWHNEPSMLAIVAYACKNDIDLDKWIVDYASRNPNYISNQKDNYLHMRDDLEKYVQDQKENN